ncbi:hypothetical protein FGB62_17g19 [Gracilaria domingensis]|nr:hypothetical protein FGB62_17g19 [Gracilaria domingensis]
MDNLVGKGVTDREGSFEIRGAPIALPDGTAPTLRVSTTYQFEDTQNGIERQLRVLYGDREYFEVNEGRVQNLGDIKMDNHRCNTYLIFYDALMDYMDRVSDALPTRANVHVDEFLDGPPFTEYDNVISDKNFDWNLGSAQHELAHVVRHFYDGDYEHFRDHEKEYKLKDFQDHICNSVTSISFAFNEGWAMYWAGDCERIYDRNASLDVAGNVAAALRNLQSLCDSSYRDMVDVLKYNEGSIHSFAEFEMKHQGLFSCP